MIYENINPQRLAAIEAKAQQALGISISGNEGTATKNGITISWVYDPQDQTLTVGDTRKPWFVPESRIDEELTALVDATGSSRETQ
ncbi:MAG: hypothetical protein ABR957_01050 [Terracidiphilus sp.]